MFIPTNVEILNNEMILFAINHSQIVEFTFVFGRKQNSLNNLTLVVIDAIVHCVVE